MGKRRSVEKTDLSGEKYTEHFDELGNKVGETRKKTGLFGSEYFEHLDNNGRIIGTSEEKEGLFGTEYIEHRDEHRRIIGSSEEKEGLFGTEYIEHRDEHRKLTGTSRKQEGILGSKYIEHEGEGGYAGFHEKETKSKSKEEEKVTHPIQNNIEPASQTNDYDINESYSYSKTRHGSSSIQSSEDIENKIIDVNASVFGWIAAIIGAIISFLFGYVFTGVFSEDEIIKIGGGIIVGILGGALAKSIGSLIGAIFGWIVSIPVQIIRFFFENKVLLILLLLLSLIGYFWLQGKIPAIKPEKISIPSIVQPIQPPTKTMSQPPAPVPSTKTNIEWSFQLKNFSGNRYDVYDQIVKDIAPSMTWQEFKDEVLIYNPQLIKDGYEFKKEKIYLLPIEE